MSQVQASISATAQYDNIHVDGSALAIFGDVYNTRDHSDLDANAEQEPSDLNQSVLYYETMHDRLDQLISAEDDTCKWIWTTKFAEWLSDPEKHVFWMSGKPGSGKSTLVKYLSTTRKLHDHLFQNGADWEVLHFYFDFRRRDNLENSLHGLFRTLLYDLIQLRRDILPKAFPGYHKGETLRLMTVVAAFKFALDTIGLNIIIFIDGLDEYAENVMDLIQQLLPLSLHKNVKLCMTSRREASILINLQKYPNFHISDPHTNEKGIAEFIKLAFHPIEEADPSHWAEICRAAVPQTIKHKAEGVFLWVSLASREIIEASAHGATVDEIIQLTNDLPEDVGHMYQRILDRIPMNRKAEAAVIYTLVAETAHRISVDLLRATLYFITCELRVPEMPRLDLSILGVGRRLMGSLGGLLEVCHTSSSRSTESYDTTSEIRLMHETVRAFSDNTRWAYDQLPHPFRLMFPDRIWARLCYEAIFSFTKCLGGKPGSMQISSQETALTYIQFQQQVKTSSVSIAQQWIRLLYFSLKYVVVYAEEDADCKDLQYHAKAEKAMKAAVSTLHIAIFEPKIAARLKESPALISADSDFVLAATHGACRYLLSRMHRLKALTDHERNDLALRITEYFSEDACLKQPEERSHTEPRLEDTRRTLDSILTLNNRVDDVHLNLFLLLGYSSTPRFLQRSPAQRRDRTTHRTSRYPIALTLAPKNFGGGSPLFTWACENAIETTNSQLTMKFQLSVLCSFGIDLHEKSLTGYPIVHYLISVHVLEHTLLGTHESCKADLEMIRTIEKLYALDGMAADFNARAFGKTPVEALEACILTFKLTTPGDRLAEMNVERVQLRLEQLQFMLRFKSRHGHLPQPMVLADPDDQAVFEFLRRKKCECKKCSGRRSMAKDAKLRLEALGPDNIRKSLPSIGSCFD